MTLSHSFNRKCVFMPDNIPFHVSRLIDIFFEHKRFTGDKIMEWPPSSPGLSLIENFSWLVGFLWHINLCRLSNTKYI